MWHEIVFFEKSRRLKTNIKFYTIWRNTAKFDTIRHNVAQFDANGHNLMQIVTI